MTLTETELQTQWRNTVDILETERNFADGTMALPTGKFGALEQSLEGEFTPSELANWVQRIRAAHSSIIEPGTVLEALTPIVFEYMGILAADVIVGFGSGYRDLGEMFTALYEWFIDKSLTVQSRNISFDTAPTLTGTGNGTISRLTADENGFDMEACHVEHKVFRCRADVNSGVQEHQETFEMMGDQSSFDALLRSSKGSGEQARSFIRSHHAGSGAGGSLLLNSSFSTFDNVATSKFTGWAQTGTASLIAQDATNFYRSFPGAGIDASMKLTGSAAGTLTFKQTIDSMSVSRLDPETPYFLRVMFNKTVGAAVDGSVTIRLGSQSATSTVLALADNWTEVIIPLGTANWFRNFNQDPFDVEIEWAGGTGGTLLIDDVLFAPFDLIDGTWWFLRGNAATHISWLVDDTITFLDTGGAPVTGKVQWWLFVAGLGYLPSTTGPPTFTDP